MFDWVQDKWEQWFCVKWEQWFFGFVQWEQRRFSSFMSSTLDQNTITVRYLNLIIHSLNIDNIIMNITSENYSTSPHDWFEILSLTRFRYCTRTRTYSKSLTTGENFAILFTSVKIRQNKFLRRERVSFFFSMHFLHCTSAQNLLLWPFFCASC